MDGDREVSFKDAEQLAHVSFIQSQWTVLFDYFTHNSNAKGFDLCVGKPGDVLWGQCLHCQECDRVPHTPGQVRSDLTPASNSECCRGTNRMYDKRTFRLLWGEWWCRWIMRCAFLSSLRVLMEQEDRVRDATVILSALPIKKKACCKWSANSIYWVSGRWSRRHKTGMRTALELYGRTSSLCPTNAPHGGHFNVDISDECEWWERESSSKAPFPVHNTVWQKITVVSKI